MNEAQQQGAGQPAQQVGVQVPVDQTPPPNQPVPVSAGDVAPAEAEQPDTTGPQDEAPPPAAKREPTFLERFSEASTTFANAIKSRTVSAQAILEEQAALDGAKAAVVKAQADFDGAEQAGADAKVASLKARDGLVRVLQDYK